VLPCPWFHTPIAIENRGRLRVTAPLLSSQERNTNPGRFETMPSRLSFSATADTAGPFPPFPTTRSLNYSLRLPGENPAGPPSGSALARLGIIQSREAPQMYAVRRGVANRVQRQEEHRR
jgi:hypothetical protein